MAHWVQFHAEGESGSGKTKIWGVVSIRCRLGKVEQKGRLGVIAWHSTRRKYCFYPSCKTSFDAGEQRDIARFCEEATRSQKTKEPR